MKAITNVSVRVIERWMPDAFLFAIILTFVVFVAAMLVTVVVCVTSAFTHSDASWNRSIS